MEKLSKDVNVRVRRDVHDEVKRMAIKRGILSATSMISAVLYEWVENEKKAEQAAMRAEERLAKKQGKVQ